MSQTIEYQTFIYMFNININYNIYLYFCKNNKLKKNNFVQKLFSISLQIYLEQPWNSRVIKSMKLISIEINSDKQDWKKRLNIKY